MIWLTCWISSRSRTHPKLFNNSLRLPRKTSGLFDTGLAGGAADVTSLDLGIPADFDQSLFSFEGINPGISDFTEDFLGQSTAVDHDLKDTTNSVPALSEWDFDVMDSLGDLNSDPLADDSLDAFVNLDSFFMEGSVFDNTSLTNNEETHVKPVDFLETDNSHIKPVLDFWETDEVAEVKPVIDFFMQADNSAKSEVNSITHFANTNSSANVLKVTKPQPAKSLSKPCKRKAQAASKPVETSLFKIPEVKGVTIRIPDPEVDHDYIVKTEDIFASCSSSSNSSNINLKKGKSTPKRKRISSTSSVSSESSVNSVASDISDVSSTGSGCFSTTFEILSPGTSLDKQTVRRMKNNVASKRSREQRKQKFAELDAEAETLIAANAGLRKKIVELEKMAKEMKELLVAKMAGTA